MPSKTECEFEHVLCHPSVERLQHLEDRGSDARLGLQAARSLPDGGRSPSSLV